MPLFYSIFLPIFIFFFYLCFNQSECFSFSITQSMEIFSLKTILWCSVNQFKSCNPFILYGKLICKMNLINFLFQFLLSYYNWIKIKKWSHSHFKRKKCGWNNYIIKQSVCLLNFKQIFLLKKFTDDDQRMFGKLNNFFLLLHL